MSALYYLETKLRIVIFLLSINLCSGQVSKDSMFTASVSIGGKIWMAGNLNVNRFRNGDEILQAKSEKEWNKANANGKPVWCYVDTFLPNRDKYGKLYNWWAVNDKRGLAPAGWHVGSVDDWESLINYLGGWKVAGKKLKSTAGWKDNGNGTNESGFNALPQGDSSGHGILAPNNAANCSWWTSTRANDYEAFEYILLYNEDIIGNNFSLISNGQFVRCVKD